MAVMLPWYSAGSKNVGAIENGAAQTICPSGAASTAAAAGSRSVSDASAHAIMRSFILPTSHAHEDGLDVVHRHLDRVFSCDRGRHPLRREPEGSVAHHLLDRRPNAGWRGVGQEPNAG